MALADQLQISEQLYSLGVAKAMEAGSVSDRLDYFEAREHIAESLARSRDGRRLCSR